MHAGGTADVSVCVLPQTWCCTVLQAGGRCFASGRGRPRPASVALSPRTELHGWTGENRELQAKHTGVMGSTETIQVGAEWICTSDSFFLSGKL